jgi:hypothetical protein
MEDHDWENDFVAWVPEAEVLQRMSFASEIVIVERALERTRARLVQDDATTKDQSSLGASGVDSRVAGTRS